MLGAKHLEVRRNHAVINARNTSPLHRDATFLYASQQLLDATFRYAPSLNFTSDAPPRRRVPLRAAAYLRPTFVNTRQLRAALLYASPFNLASDAQQRRRVSLRAVATSRLRSSTPSSPCNSVHGSINAESLVAQPRASQNNLDPKRSIQPEHSNLSEQSRTSRTISIS